MSDEKKAVAVDTLPGDTSGSNSIEITTQVDEAQGYDQKATKALLRKLDWNIIPFMSLIYLLCFLDRTNIGNARLDNLEKDLGLTGIQYNDCLAILFPFYIAAEIPSNMMMKRVRASRWLTFIMFFWSVSMICQGFVKNYAGMLATRVFLGLFEGGLYPGVNYYITQWYCRRECGFRMALFFSAATMAGAFGGILARGIAEMRGVGGLPAWSWIFILEGLLSVLVSFAAPFAIHDSPAQAKFLTPLEQAEVERRLKADAGHLSNEFDVRYVWQALGDWKIYIHMLICMAGFCPIYSFSLFLPTIVKGMGYTANDAQLMTVPPYVVACCFTIAASYFADKWQRRGVFIMGFQLVGIAGFALLCGTDNSKAQYVGTVLAAVGIYPQIPLGLAWNSGNIGGSLKRGTGIAMQVMGGNCGGIIASYVYLSRDGPRYITGHSILIGFISMAFFLSLFMSTWCQRENARRAAISPELGADELNDEQKEMEREKADNVPWFRYTT
ncbi:high-affinity nicotinic acid transporter [Pyricularia oryzae 70-15]|uniref:High-affinity nicotinic acid transporter n=3 Tax=Pyricularia oryzae TaxID=318829 RepID=G4MNR3_PYRO7|nr:high-affinity nicotinic acid transporter [Pyricularia oryzae 70-15]EHA56279.1 high-affinity nicotinic acid transporter [Pyricularia oryzae 70-15]ELQ37755.1 high-affinity nicotinic acid transporter [Pyricularia oryzae Y34]KAI7913863.1 high-affinity nicotinic acid transporter [Pyricularia oryzae]KAI7922455.1 high-affinity nicotinic acid transporter [Pyricularia oryzae]